MPSPKTLQDFVQGRATELVLRGSPPTRALKNLQQLDELGFLTMPMAWNLLAQADIDPLFLIRTLRKHKQELGFVEEEIHLGDGLAFCVPPKEGESYKILYEVEIFTNDISVMVLTGAGYYQHNWVSASQLYDDLKTEPVGEKRLETLFDAVKRHLDAARAYR